MTRSINLNISHSCRWLPDIMLPSGIMRYFSLRLLTLTRHCCTLLEYPPSATPWITLSHTSFLLCIVFNLFCTTSSLHKAIENFVSRSSIYRVKICRVCCAAQPLSTCFASSQHSKLYKLLTLYILLLERWEKDH